MAVPGPVRLAELAPGAAALGFVRLAELTPGFAVAGPVRLAELVPLAEARLAGAALGLVRVSRRPGIQGSSSLSESGVCARPV